MICIHHRANIGGQKTFLQLEFSPTLMTCQNENRTYNLLEMIDDATPCPIWSMYSYFARFDCLHTQFFILTFHRWTHFQNPHTHKPPITFFFVKRSNVFVLRYSTCTIVSAFITFYRHFTLQVTDLHYLPQCHASYF